MTISKLSGQERLRATQAAAALRKNAAKAPPPVPGPAQRPPDAVTISDSAKSLAAARKAVAAVPDVREDRVAALKAAIADGSYTVDSRQLAGELAREL